MQEEPAEHPLKVSHDDLVELQKTDESLEPVGRQVKEIPDGVSSRGGFFTRDGVLYHTRTPVEQLVLPQQCRRAELAHSILLAGHLGKKKIAQRLLQYFYWPTLFKTWTSTVVVVQSARRLPQGGKLLLPSSHCP